uniref:Alpha-carbonic anhydrase domain-containing protein n=2 Tax=Stomoxys calcitrans TaxID=35570 RepID=A0A1I8PY33_STOCA
MEADNKTYPRIDYEYYGNALEVTITNNGHTALIKLSNNAVKPRISRGPLPANETYEFDSLLFHWGANNSLGSEHVLNDHRFSVEVQAVHYNTKYKNFDEAIQHSDGVAILTAFYQTNPFQRLTALNDVTNALFSIVEYESSTKISDFKLSGIYGGIDKPSKSVYYTYAGSLTTPPCSETVTWIIFPIAVFVAPYQLKPFRMLMDKNGEELVNNFRKLQDLNGRKILINRSGYGIYRNV